MSVVEYPYAQGGSESDSTENEPPPPTEIDRGFVHYGPHGQAIRSGGGAAVGHFVGIMAKFSLGTLVWLILAVAAFRG